MGDTCVLPEGLVLTEHGVSVQIGGVTVCADTVVSLIDSGALVLDGLSARELTVVLQLVEIARRRTEAVLTRVVDRAERCGAYAVDGHKAVRGWVKASARWSNAQARTQREIAWLVRVHPLCRREYRAGRLGLAQMALLAKLANHPRAGVHFARCEELLVEDAQRLEYEDFRKECEHWLNLADMDGADQDEALRHYLRNGACITSPHDGMTHLDAHFAAAQGVFVKNVFDRFYAAETMADWEQARAEHGQLTTKSDLARTDEQRRADALYAIFSRAASADPDATAPEPIVEVFVDLDTAEHLAARAIGAEVTRIDPASYRTRRCHWANGDPAAPADVAAAMMIGQIRRVITDAAGTVIDLGRRCRLFRGSSRVAARLQHWRCLHPGCGVLTKHAQIDHNNSWLTLGVTAPHNAHIKCGHHNRFKQTGYTTWQDPTGHWHTRRPDGTDIQAV